MDTKATRELIGQFNDARLANDPEKIATLVADDVAWFPPIGFREAGVGTVKGREDVVSGLTGGSGSAAASIMKMDTVSRTIQKLVVEGDTAVGFHLVSADLVAGGSYRNEYVWRYTCANGKITHIYEYADTLHANNQIANLSSVMEANDE